MKKLFFFVLTFFMAASCLTQNSSSNKIVGIVYQKNAANTKKPIPAGASVFIPGVGSSTTDDNGYYSINLAQCSACTPGETLKIYVNSSIGYAERDYVIPTNPALKPFDIEVTENKKLALNGIVKDKQTGKFIKGIKVTVVIQNYETTLPSTITDDNGVFQLIIRKEGVLNIQAIQIIFSDVDNGKYKDLEKTVFINQYEPVKVEMEECSDCGSKQNLKVNAHVKSDINVEEGDLVIIKADGVIKVGEWVGTSGPEGLQNGVLGVSLSSYNIFPNWNHAALYYRFGEKDDWKYYDEKKNKYVVQTKGYIEFGINDKNLSDNSGAYNVEVIVRK